MKRVLIVEDELLIADILEEVLVSDGFEVCGIARGIKEALTLAEQHAPELAIVDVHLIDGYGTDLAPVLMDRYRTRIVYTTANIDAVTNAVGHACLRKPFRLSLVRRAIDITLQRSSDQLPIPVLLSDSC